MADSIKTAMSRTWAEIDLDALAHNVKTLRGLLTNNAKFLGVCKANAYGHGMLAVAKKLQECKADMLAVASVQEGVELRKHGITLPILCLGQAAPEIANLNCEYGITQAVGDFQNAKALSDTAVELHKKIKIHVKIDTGMGRLGFFWHEAGNNNLDEKNKTAQEIADLCKLPGLEPEGIFTHFADADGRPEYTHSQINKLNEIREYLAKLGVTFKIAHAAASTGVLKYPESHFNMGRLGLALYGYASPEKGNSESNVDLKPVMTVKTRISAVRKLPANSSVSYGCTCTLKRDSVIAVLPLGYADGYPRCLGNNARVKIHNEYCPVIGRVCMDMIMADITDIKNVKAGDIAVIYDKDLLPEAAVKAQTIIDEIVCRVMPRITRIYIDNGRMFL